MVVAIADPDDLTDELLDRIEEVVQDILDGRR